jgi:hypothetical protein
MNYSSCSENETDLAIIKNNLDELHEDNNSNNIYLNEEIMNGKKTKGT